MSTCHLDIVKVEEVRGEAKDLREQVAALIGENEPLKRNNAAMAEDLTALRSTKEALEDEMRCLTDAVRACCRGSRISGQTSPR